MKSGNIIPQGNFSADVWVKIYENELTVAATSVTISGLDGNTDVMYRLQVRQVGGAATNTIGVRPNNDSAANYGYQGVDGVGATAEAVRNTSQTSLLIGYSGTALNSLSWKELFLYAKSGYIRTSISTAASEISGTTITEIDLLGGCWNNTADNITSMVVFTSVASGLGIGTFIELWKPLAKV